MNNISKLTKRFLFVAVLTMIIVGCKRENAGLSGIEHVLVIGIDALSPNGIANSHTPNIDAL